MLRKYPDDSDLLEDVIIENKQAMEMCAIYRDIMSARWMRSLPSFPTTSTSS